MNCFSAYPLPKLWYMSYWGISVPNVKEEEEEDHTLQVAS
jgi:hypothetical protein